MLRKVMFDRNKKQSDTELAEEAWSDEEQTGAWRPGMRPPDTEQTAANPPDDGNGAGERLGKTHSGEAYGPRDEEAGRLLHSLSRTHEAEQRYGPESPLAAQLDLLRAWQSRRLARTYADLADDPHYARACRFLLEDIYMAPRDFARQGEDLQRVYELALRGVPGWIVRPVIQALELYNLSEDLDHALLDVLVNRLGMTDHLTPQLYAEAYRLCDNYALRVRQIELMVEVVHAMDGLVRLPMVTTTMRLGRLAASRAGLVELHNFVERGVTALQEMGGADAFVSIIRQREMQILDRIFAGDPDPF